MSRNRPLLLMLVASGLVVSIARGEGKGTITGTVSDAGKVSAVSAVDRASDKKYPGMIDAKTDRFTIADVPTGTALDLLVDYDGARLEGVNLKVKRSDYEEEQPLSDEDVAALKKAAHDLNKFEDMIEVLAIEGNIQHAAVLIYKQRTKAFINANAGEMIWRLELWHFEKPDETWIKDQDELFMVLYRERMPQKEFEKKAIALDPKLGGIVVTKEKPSVNVGRLELPAKKAGVRMKPGYLGRIFRGT